MTTKKFSNALGNIGENYVDEAATYTAKKKINPWLKWGAIAACFCLIISMIIVLPMLREDEPSILPEPGTTDNPVVNPPNNGLMNNEGNSAILTPNNGTGNGGEEAIELESYYDFEINSVTFAAYINGKVIDAEKVGKKIVSVTVTGGWKNNKHEWISTEALNAELYEITGIDRGIAVALRFIDQSDGATTIHYYVMMNPNADLSDVKEYVRDPIDPNKSSDEMGNEYNE